MTTYEVYYEIQVNSETAVKNIQRMMSAANTAKFGFEKLTAAADKLQTALNACKSATVTLNTDAALDKLTQLEAKLISIRDMAATTMNVGGSTSGGGRGGNQGAPKPAIVPPTGYVGSGKNMRYYGSSRPTIPAEQGYDWSQQAKSGLTVPGKYAKAWDAAEQQIKTARETIASVKPTLPNHRVTIGAAKRTLADAQSQLLAAKSDLANIRSLESQYVANRIQWMQKLHKLKTSIPTTPANMLHTVQTQISQAEQQVSRFTRLMRDAGMTRLAAQNEVLRHIRNVVTAKGGVTSAINDAKAAGAPIRLAREDIRAANAAKACKK